MSGTSRQMRATQFWAVIGSVCSVLCRCRIWWLLHTTSDWIQANLHFAAGLLALCRRLETELRCSAAVWRGRLLSGDTYRVTTICRMVETVQIGTI